MSVETIKHKIPTHKSKFIVSVPILSEIINFVDGFLVFEYWSKNKNKLETRYYSIYPNINPSDNKTVTDLLFEENGKIWYLCEEPTKTIICTN